MPTPLAQALATFARAVGTPPPGDPLAALEQRVARVELLMWALLLSSAPDIVASAAAAVGAGQ